MSNNEFETTEIVALYLGKSFGVKQMPKIKQLVEFLIGSSEGFDFKNENLMNKIRELLLLNKDLAWLKTLSYNRKEFEKWIANIKKTHGEKFKLVKA